MLSKSFSNHGQTKILKYFWDSVVTTKNSLNICNHSNAFKIMGQGSLLDAWSLSESQEEDQSRTNTNIGNQERLDKDRSMRIL